METVWATPVGKDLQSARSQFIEFYGATVVMNRYLRVAVLCLCAVCVGVTTVAVSVVRTASRPKPLIIRINELGRAEAMNYDSLVYQPHEREVRYFLIEFIKHHYSRLRATVRENYPRSLMFLDSRLSEAINDSNKKTHAIENFLVGGMPEIDINIKNVSIEDLRHPPYRATVEFEQIYYTYPEHLEQKRERFVANVSFVFSEHVPNVMIPVNPLGLTITYFRLDQAFQ